MPYSTQSSPKTTPRQHVQNISMANFAKVLTVISAALLIVKSAEGIRFEKFLSLVAYGQNFNS